MRAARPLAVLALLLLPAAAPAVALATLPFGVSAGVPVAVPQAEPDAVALASQAAGLTLVATVTVLQDEVWSYTGGYRTRTIAVPEGWTRAVLVFREVPMGDPWDRLFAAHINGVEVLRGTTPRTDMTVRRDVTEYASLLPPGGTAQVGGYTDTYVGAMRVTLTLEFYNDPAAVAELAPDRVVGAFNMRWNCADDRVHAAPVQFPEGAWDTATLELFATGHSAAGEFWFLQSLRPRIIHVSVDGTEVAQAVMMPYTYAFVGFAGSFGELVHPLMWWTAQQALDIAGVPDGVGEIPPYRATLLPEHLALLQGAREVTMRMEGGGCVWPTSVSFHLDDVA